MTRRLLVALLGLVVVACADSPPTPTLAEPAVGAVGTAAPAKQTAAATSAPGATAPTTAAPAATPILVPEAVDAALVLADYVYALYEDPAGADAFLVPELRAPARSLVAQSTLIRIGSIRQVGAATPSQVTFAVELLVDDPPANSPWSRGPNARWVRVVRLPEGWRVAEIASAPL